LEHTGPIAGQLNDCPPFAAPGVVPGSTGNEKSDDYGGVVAVLNPKLRVIRGACGLQWIAQKKVSSTGWKSFAYCGTKEGLLLRLPKPDI